MDLDSNFPILFLFAHPDDDAFIAGTLRLLIDRGVDVHCAWLTSGDHFGKVEVREAELRSAARVLRLEPSHMHLFKLPDLGLVSHMTEALDLVRTLMGDLKPKAILAPAFEGGHPDHDSVNFFAFEGASKAGIEGPIFEFPLYNGSGPLVHWRWRINRFVPGGPKAIPNPLTESAIDCKYQVMRIYSSQWMFMIPARLASRRQRLRTSGEPYRLCPPQRDHSVKPHPGKLNYERWFNAWMKLTFANYRQAVIEARKGPS